MTDPLDVLSPHGPVSHGYKDEDLGVVGRQRIATYVTEENGTGRIAWKLTCFDGLRRVIQERTNGPEGKIIVTDTIQ